MNEESQQTKDMNKIEKSEIEKMSENALTHSLSALTGMMVGQSLSGPIKALDQDLKNRIKERRVSEIINNNGNVTRFKSQNPIKEYNRQDRLKKNKKGRYKLTPGLPSTKAALVGSAVGGLLGPKIVKDVKRIKSNENNESEELTKELEKEASENYRKLPRIGR